MTAVMLMFYRLVAVHIDSLIFAFYEILQKILNMPKKTQAVVALQEEFELFELVFAKLKGSPEWPARIVEFTGSKVKVEFLGDNRSM